MLFLAGTVFFMLNPSHYGISMNERDNYEEYYKIKFTHPDRIKIAPENQCVALVVYNTNGDVLLAKRSEKENLGPGKWSILTETREPKFGERVSETVERGLLEELGQKKDQFIVLDGSYRFVSAVSCQRRNGYYYTIRCFQLLFTGDGEKDPNQVFRFPPREINRLAWVSPHHIGRFDIETEAKDLITYYFTPTRRECGLIFPQQLLQCPPYDIV